MDARTGRAFYLHNLDIAKNVDRSAQVQRNHFDNSLRTKPDKSPEERALSVQNKLLKDKIAKLENKA